MPPGDVGFLNRRTFRVSCETPAQIAREDWPEWIDDLAVEIERMNTRAVE